MSNATLDTIREAEFEAARRIESARTEAQTAIDEARTNAGRIVDEARAAGRREADRRYESQIATAEAEAAEITAESNIGRMRAAVEPCLPALVDAIVELVLRPPTGER